MPVASRAFPAYFTLRYVKQKDICIFKLPSRNGKSYKQWEDDLISELSKCLETDDNMKRRIYSRDIHFCERHFAKENIQFTRMLVCSFI